MADIMAASGDGVHIYQLCRYNYRHVIVPFFVSMVALAGFVVVVAAAATFPSISFLRGYAHWCSPLHQYQLGQADLNIVMGDLFPSRPPAPSLLKTWLIGTPVMALHFALSNIPWVGVMPGSLVGSAVFDAVWAKIGKKYGADVQAASFFGDVAGLANFNGLLQMGLMAAYPAMISINSMFAGSCLSIVSSTFDFMLVSAIKNKCSKALKADPRFNANATRLKAAQGAIYFVMFYTEGVRFATLISACWIDPDDFGWTSSIATSLVSGILGRSGYMAHVAYKMSGNPSLAADNLVTFMVRECKYTGTVAKYGLAGSLMAVRALVLMLRLGGHMVSIPVYVNMSLVIVFFCSAAADAIQDLAVWTIAKLDLGPKPDAKVLHYIGEIQQDDIMNQAQKRDEHGQINMAFTWKDPTWMFTWHQFLYQAMYTPLLGLVCLVGIEAVIGYTDQVVPSHSPVLTWPPGWKIG